MSLALLLALPAAWAELQTQTIEYQDGDTSLKGYLVYDDSIEGPRPGILVAHEWWGLNDYIRQRAEMIAELGYVAFALDMYGDDRVTEHAPDAQGWMQQITANLDTWHQRARAGLEILQGQEQVDATRLAALGWCFGGATVMQLAYAGADLAAVVSFHGSLPPAPDGVTIKPSVLAAHGAADDFVPPERVQAFQDSLTAAGADWQLVSYGGARHGFTNPLAGDYGMDNLAYDANADRRSWDLMQALLEEVFAD
ncbi:MAG: dienelactone hydrolase family protein [Chromatiaceae bacterium]|nr:MAG: dienelactone hydrolase family protein [Chromatiaceae bacterium]